MVQLGVDRTLEDHTSLPGRAHHCSLTYERLAFPTHIVQSSLPTPLEHGD
jgi:hypothetical protein